MSLDEPSRGLPRGWVSIVPCECQVTKHDSGPARSLNDQNGRKTPDVIRGVVEYEAALLHPAVGIERVGLHAKNPCGKNSVARKEIEQRQRVEQAGLTRRKEQRPQMHESR